MPDAFGSPSCSTVFGVKQPARHHHFLVPGFTVHFRNMRREQIRRRHDALDGPRLRFMNRGIPIGMDRVQRLGQSVLDPVFGVEHNQAVRIPVRRPGRLPRRAS